MYACVHETGRGFFEGVCTTSNATAYSCDPPPPRFALHLCGLSTQRLLRSFTDWAICGKNRGNRCPYPPFPFPTYYPDTGTGSGNPNRILISSFAQPSAI
jgi:hypothetical protein